MISLTASDAMTVLAMMVAVSAGVAGVVEVVKAALRLAHDQWEGHPAERVTLRSLAVLLGVGALLPLGSAYGVPWTVSAAAGALAGASSEVVYRWVLRWLESRLGARNR